MNARSSADIGLDQALYAKKIGLDYIELSVDRIMKYDEKRFESFKKEVSESPLPCLACNNFIDPSIKLAGREYNDVIFEFYLRNSLSRIASIGVKKVVFGSGKSRNIPSYLSSGEGKVQVIECIEYITKEAEKHGIEIEIENLNRIECNCINTFEESVSIVKELKLPNLKCALDYFHFAVSGENENLIKQNAEWIGHIHFAPTLGRMMPNLDEAKKMLPLFTMLKDCSYDGTFSLEAYFPNFEMDNMYYKDVIDYLRESINGR